MQQKETTPFKATYRVFHKPTRQFHGDFDRLVEAVYHLNWLPRHPHQPRISYTLTREGKISYYDWTAPRIRVGERYEFARALAPPAEWVIVVDDRAVTEAEINHAEVEASRQRRATREAGRQTKYDRQDMQDRRLLRKHGNVGRIKTSYAYTIFPSWGYYGEDHYDSLVRGYFRCIRTTQEHRLNAAHADEYGQTIVRGRRRGRILPDTRSERMCDASHQQRSWKHHSKRKKQWIPK